MRTCLFIGITFPFYKGSNNHGRRTRRQIETRRITPPKCVALPPVPTLAAAALVSHTKLLPANVQGAPSAFLLTALLANLNLLAESAIYTKVLSLAPIAISLLLLQHTRIANADRLSAAFAVGALGSTLGAIVAMLVSPLPPSTSCKLAGVFAATYIGGTVNYIGVADAVGLEHELVAAGLAADMAVMAGYITILFAISQQMSGAGGDETPSTRGVDTDVKRGAKLVELCVPICVALGICAFSSVMSARLHLPSGAALLITTALSMGVSRYGRVQKYMRLSLKLGGGVLSLFFGALGATTSLRRVIARSPHVLQFAAIVLVVHALVVYWIGHRLLHLSGAELAVASNANVGGSSTAAAFAAAMGWKHLVAAAVAVGAIGYAIGTPIGLLLIQLASMRL